MLTFVQIAGLAMVLVLSGLGNKTYAQFITNPFNDTSLCGGNGFTASANANGTWTYVQSGGGTTNIGPSVMNANPQIFTNNGTTPRTDTIF